MRSKLLFIFFGMLLILAIPEKALAERKQIVYNLNGGAFSDSVSTEWVTGSIKAVPTPTRENYSFVGWYTEGNCEVCWLHVLDHHGFLHRQSRCQSLLCFLVKGLGEKEKRLVLIIQALPRHGHQYASLCQ